MIAFAGYLGAAGFAWLILFQLGLAAGLPYGHMAWGGGARKLPAPLRLASLASAALAGVGVIAVLQAAGLIAPVISLIPPKLLLGALALLFSLSLVGNALSQSRAERLHGVPLTLILAGTTGVLAMAVG